jgi:hypothetical protein
LYVGELYDDVSINIHYTIDIQDVKKTIECNTKEQIRNCFMEIKNIAFEKLNDLEFKNTIQVHDTKLSLLFLQPIRF